MATSNDNKGGGWRPWSDARRAQYQRVLADVAARYKQALDIAFNDFRLTDERAAQAAAFSIYNETMQILAQIPADTALAYQPSTDPRENLAQLAQYVQAAGVSPAQGFSTLVSQLSGRTAGEVLDALRDMGINTNKGIMESGPLPLALAERVLAALKEKAHADN